MSKQRKGFKKVIAITISLIMFVTLLAACASNDSQGDDQKRILRIATVYGDSNYTDHLRSQYTDLFQFANRNIEIEFVTAIDYGSRRYQNYNSQEPEPDPVEEMIKLMEGPNPPDVLLLSQNELPSLVNENMLTPLEPLIAEDNFDISDFVPAVIDGLKSLGNDQLYALAPTFSSQALIYNKGLFIDQGVPFPEDQMYWDEIFDLATRLTTGEGENKKYGFSFNSYYHSDLYYDMRAYVAPLELHMFDDEGEAMSVDSQAWADVWQDMYNLHQSNVLPEPPDYNQMNQMIYNPYDHDAFMSGKLAMTIIDYARINEIINNNRDADLIEGYEYIDWDVVTMPVHPQAPNFGGNAYMDPVIAINAQAQNRDDAWRFLKFMNSEEWAELKSQSSYNMVSRQSYIRPRDGIQFNLEAFFKLSPAPANNDYLTISQKYNPDVMWRIESIGQQKFRDVIDGNLTVSEALSQWQTEGDALLQQFRENPEMNIWEPSPPMMQFEGLTPEEQEMLEMLNEAAGESPSTDSSSGEVEFEAEDDVIIIE